MDLGFCGVKFPPAPKKKKKKNPTRLSYQLVKMCGRKGEEEWWGLETVNSQTLIVELDNWLALTHIVWWKDERCQVSFNWIWTHLFKPLSYSMRLGSWDEYRRWKSYWLPYLRANHGIFWKVKWVAQWLSKMPRTPEGINDILIRTCIAVLECIELCDLDLDIVYL